jgi:hypothetical protein
MPTMHRYVFTWMSPQQNPFDFAHFRGFNFILECPIGRIADVGPGGVDRHSMAIATICELQNAPGHSFEFPMIGAAVMQVWNVAPRDDGVVVLWVDVEWWDSLHVSLNILVVNGA